jgi:hypothetical protein
MTISALDPFANKHNWVGFELGFGGDTGVVYHKGSTDGFSSVSGQFGQQPYNTTAFHGQVPIFVGGRVGVGSFKDNTHWHGAAFGFAYSPTYIESSDERVAAELGGFQPIGFTLSLDYATLEAKREKWERSPHFRIFYRQVFATDGGFHTGTGGLGAAWY